MRVQWLALLATIFLGGGSRLKYRHESRERKGNSSQNTEAPSHLANDAKSFQDPQAVKPVTIKPVNATNETPIGPGRVPTWIKRGKRHLFPRSPTAFQFVGWGPNPFPVRIDNYQDSMGTALVASNHSKRRSDPFLGLLMMLGGGTGMWVDGKGNTELEADLDSRARYQSNAVVLMVMFVYFTVIALGLNFLYWHVKNISPVTYYADPRYHTLRMEGDNLESFIGAFNQTPRQMHLQVTGFQPVGEWDDNQTVYWKGAHYSVAFTFALDLTSWVRPGNNVANDQSEAGTGEVNTSGFITEEGINEEDISNLQQFLAHDDNDLAMVTVQKDVTWPGWEELATNIKQHIRQSGFNGVVNVSCSEGESVTVYKNKLWANFLHHRATRSLMALSIFGWPFYLVYMWLRCRNLLIHTHHRVDITPDAYWPLISDQLITWALMQHTSNFDNV